MTAVDVFFVGIALIIIGGAIGIVKHGTGHDWKRERQKFGKDDA